MKKTKSPFCMHYLILKVWKYSDLNCAHGTILIEAGPWVHTWLWPDLESSRFHDGWVGSSRCWAQVRVFSSTRCLTHSSHSHQGSWGRWGSGSSPAPQPAGGAAHRRLPMVAEVAAAVAVMAVDVQSGWISRLPPVNAGNSDCARWFSSSSMISFSSFLQSSLIFCFSKISFAFQEVTPLHLALWFCPFFSILASVSATFSVAEAEDGVFVAEPLSAAATVDAKQMRWWLQRLSDAFERLWIFIPFGHRQDVSRWWDGRGSTTSGSLFIP